DQRPMFDSNSVIRPVTQSCPHRQHKCDSVAGMELAIQASKSLLGWWKRNRLVIQKEMRCGAPTWNTKGQRKGNRLLCMDSEMNLFLKRIICFFMNLNNMPSRTNFSFCS